MPVPVLEIESISFCYPPVDPTGTPIVALDDISLRVNPGEFVALIGQNGSGKSTLARQVNGLLRPDRGVVRLMGEDIRDQEPGELVDRAGYVFQNPDHALFLPTIREEIAYGLERIGLVPAERQARIETTLERFGLTELADQHPASFGRGMRRLIVIAAISALEPRLLVLDEPTSGLDRGHAARLLAILNTFRQQSTAIMLITHDMRLVAEHCDRVLLLHRGRLLADAPVAEIFHDQVLMQDTGLRPPVSARLASDLTCRGVPGDIVTVEQIVDALTERWRQD